MSINEGIRPSRLEPFGAPISSQLDVWGLPRGPHAVSPETIQASQRSRMLFGVVAAAAERGYTHCTVADICRIAHVSRKTFYEQFASREACFLAAYETGHASLVRSILASQHDGQTWDERLDSSIRALLCFFRDNPELTRALLIEIRSGGDRAWQIYDTSHARLARMQRTLYRMRRQLQPSLPELPFDIFFALVIGVERLVIRYVRANRLPDLMQLEPTLRFLLLSCWSGEPSAVAALLAGNPPLFGEPEDESADLPAYG